MKTESPQFMRGNVADPKRSKDHLATLQESLKLPLIRHNHQSRHLWNLERSARDFFFSSSSLNGSRVRLMLRCFSLPRWYNKHKFPTTPGN